MFTKIFCIWKRLSLKELFLKEAHFAFKKRLHLTLAFRTAKNVCPNFQKPPLHLKIPGYAPAQYIGCHFFVLEVRTHMFTYICGQYAISESCRHYQFPSSDFCGRASWTLNPRNVTMFSSKKRREMEDLSVYSYFLDSKVSIFYTCLIIFDSFFFLYLRWKILNNCG